MTQIIGHEGYIGLFDLVGEACKSGSASWFAQDPLMQAVTANYSSRLELYPAVLSSHDRMLRLGTTSALEAAVLYGALPAMTRRYSIKSLLME